LLAACTLGALIWQIATAIQLFREKTFGDALGSSSFWIALGITAASVGVLVLELYAIWFRSRRASEAVGIIFSAPAFIALPPIVEAFAKLVHIPGISESSADGKTVGILLAVGTVSGFIGFVHFAWYGRLRRAPSVVKVESIPETVTSTTEPMPPPATAS